MAQHIHKYRRVNIGREKEYWVMACSSSGCNHYTPMRSKLSAPALLGKVSLCNRCNEKFELSRRALRMANPVCDDCIGTKEKKIVEKAENFFEELEKGLFK